MLLASCGEGVLPSSEALALSSECSQVKELSRVSPADEALLVPNLQRVVVGVELVEGFGDVAGPVGEGARKAVSVRILLVAVEEALQLEAVVADIGDVEQGVLGELLLHAEEVALDVAVAGVLGDPGDVVGGWVEGGDQADGIALIGGGVAAWSRGASGDDLGGQRLGHDWASWA